ncbi:xylulokinase [Salinarimonas soli]|uniref:Xylulose kinase n=1 Tax=Salinarimonas soli TaxID=1638099 RepID=A0A5B2VZ73_9HYPH|nr:xylulokinase [Salinarimonas soli]KAA2244335.1 xylulokinase [Salinarimonas soli]
MAAFLGLDIGTSSVKAVLVDEAGAALAEAGRPLAVSRPRPLWSEQDPEDWWTAAREAVEAVRAAAPQAWRELAAIGLSGQMHGATLLDGAGRPLRPAILWNDGRCAAECAELERRVPRFRARASNVAMPGFTAPKLLWVAAHEPDIFAATRMVLLPKDYVRFRLTGEFVGEMSDAAGTLWLDIARRRWDDELLAACGLTSAQVPRLVEGSQVSGHLSPDLARAWGLDGRAIPVAGGAGDNAASAIGIGAVAPGDGFLSLGTSGVLFAATDGLRADPDRTLHAFCHALPELWHVMAVTLAAASALSWVAGLTGQGDDIPGLIARAEAFASDESRRAAAPLFLPYLTGERTPHNDAGATGLFAGLRAEHGADALCHAVLEGVALAFVDDLEVLRGADVALTSCMLVGGGSRSAFWAQLLADALGIPLDRPAGAATGAATGAARLAMLCVAPPERMASICAKPPVERRFEPRQERHAEMKPRHDRFRELYRAEVATRPELPLSSPPSAGAKA